MVLSSTTIETGLWHIQRHLIYKYGIVQAERDMAPLHWYISTGRASMQFLHALLDAKPFMVARKLHEGGSDQEVIGRILRYLRLGDCAI